MNFRRFGLSIVFGASVGFSFAPAGFAQNAAPQTKQSAGLSLSITSATLHAPNIIIQFELKNSPQARIYVRDAMTDDSQMAFLGSGAHLSSPNSVVSIEHCNSIQSCLSPNDPGSRDINAYSYIEPSDSLSFSFQYQANSPVQQHDTISFSVALIARFAQSNGEASNASPPRPIRFNFSNVPIAQ
jgi:hypothetical protein